MPKEFKKGEEYCPNCGQYTGGESACPNCGAILDANEEDEFDGFHEDDEDIDAKDLEEDDAF